MARTPLPRHLPNPRRSNTFLDTCAFDPKYTPEDDAAQEIRAISVAGDASILLAHSNQKELEHRNTPKDVLGAARDMIYTLEVELTPEEKASKAQVHAIITGNGTPDKYAADAAHVFEAGKYMGYFVTTDQRILNRRDELRVACAANILTPSEWLSVFRAADE